MIKRLLYSFLVVACTALAFSSCAKENSDTGPYMDVDGLSKENSAIRDYLRDKKQDSGLVVHPSGMCYRIIDRGTGSEYITRENVPVVVYTRHLLPSEKFVESSFNLPTSFDGRKLKNHILGWQIGLPLIPKGGRIIMYIPSSLAFGATGIPGTIPPNAILICDVTLVDFN